MCGGGETEGQKEKKRDSPADSPLSTEPDVGSRDHDPS